MSDLPRATRRGVFVWAAVLVLAGVGAALAWPAYRTPAGPDTVTQVLVETKPGLVGDAAETKAMFALDTPDLYVVLVTAAGPVRLPPFADTPVGSGLLYELPRPVDLADLREIEVWDDDPVSDDLLDRVRRDVEGDPRVIEGGKFRVVLRGRVAKPAVWALPALVVAGVVGALALGKLIWDQVI